MITNDAYVGSRMDVAGLSGVICNMWLEPSVVLKCGIGHARLISSRYRGDHRLLLIASIGISIALHMSYAIVLSLPHDVL
jgi:hypothetical protein